MSTLSTISSKCFLCGHESEQTVIMSTNSFGSPDLDTRPPEMQRSTMRYWIHECPFCGYISEDISDETDITADWINSDEFREYENLNFLSDLALQYYKYYLINIKDENHKDAFFALLHAAWACDDAEDFKNSTRCRQLSIPLLEELINETKNENFIVMKADLLRRSGYFERVIEEYSNIVLNNPLLNNIIAFQIEKAKTSDANCYTVKDIQNESD